MKAREATLADKAAVIELWKSCALTRPWNDPSQDFDFAHAGPASAVIVLESDSVIVGAALVGHDGHRGSTYYVGVEPKLQGNGAGRALMAAVEDWLRARKVWKLNLLVRRENDGVVRFMRISDMAIRIVLRSENGWMADQIDLRAIERLFPGQRAIIDRRRARQSLLW